MDKRFGDYNKADAFSDNGKLTVFRISRIMDTVSYWTEKCPVCLSIRIVVMSIRIVEKLARVTR